MKVKFYSVGEIDERELRFAVICAKYKDRWILVRHKQRNTWEIPGGHREIGENIDRTATRELFEETGAKDFTIKPIHDYSVTREGVTTYGRLYFGKVEVLGKLPNLEIGEVRLFDELPQNLTHPEIQPYLHEKVKKSL